MTLLKLVECFLCFLCGIFVFSLGIFLLEFPTTILVFIGLAVWVFGGYGVLKWAVYIFNKLKK